MRVCCPDCSELIPVPEGARPGDLLECPNCAGRALRLRQDGGRWTATLAYRVSCPHCDDVVTLPEDLKAGDTVIVGDSTQGASVPPGNAPQPGFGFGFRGGRP